MNLARIIRRHHDDAPFDLGVVEQAAQRGRRERRELERRECH
jgi:hypothetical protein